MRNFLGLVIESRRPNLRIVISRNRGRRTTRRAKSKGVREMKYILMMNIPKAGYGAFGEWSQKHIAANIAFVKSMNKTLSESGEFVAAEGLAPPDHARVVAAGED